MGWLRFRKIPLQIKYYNLNFLRLIFFRYDYPSYIKWELVTKSRHVNSDKAHSNHKDIYRSTIILEKNRLHDQISIIVKISNGHLHSYKS